MVRTAPADGMPGARIPDAQERTLDRPAAVGAHGRVRTVGQGNGIRRIDIRGPAPVARNGACTALLSPGTGLAIGAMPILGGASSDVIGATAARLRARAVQGRHSSIAVSASCRWGPGAASARLHPPHSASRNEDVMADFQRFFPHLLRFEGGYVNDPADPGGATNKGITFATFRRHAQALLGVAPSLETLRALTDAQAAVLYRRLYWDPLHGDAISLQPLAEIVFDFYVNAGANAIKLLQRVLNELGAQPRLQVDGAFGPGTFAALQAADPVAVYLAYRKGRVDYYRTLVARRPSLQRFLRGWLARVEAFPANPTAG